MDQRGDVEVDSEARFPPQRKNTANCCAMDEARSSHGLKEDKRRLTAEVGENIVSELGKGNVQEAFWHLKGWYPTASEAQARPCHLTMERQTDERVELYAERDAYGAEFPANGTPFGIDDNPPSDEELRTAVSQLSHGRCGGASGI